MTDITSSVSFSTLEIKANYTCNSRCIFCCAGNRGGLRTMTFDEIAANVDFFMETRGITEVCLSGGEPTVHPDFAATLALLREKGLRTYLHTNAIRFQDPSLARTCGRLVDRVLVGISFHDADLCAALTGTGRTFAGRLAGITHLLDSGLPLRTNTVILKQNYTHLPAIAQGIADLGVSRSLLTFPFFFEGNPQQINDFVPPDLAAVRPCLDQAITVLQNHGIEVSLQGLPPCKLGEWAALREKDPDRALVDSEHQFHGHSMLFSKTLGYFKNESCRNCPYNTSECWGYPRPGGLGPLGTALALPDEIETETR